MYLSTKTMATTTAMKITNSVNHLKIFWCSSLLCVNSNIYFNNANVLNEIMTVQPYINIHTYTQIITIIAIRFCTYISWINLSRCRSALNIVGSNINSGILYRIVRLPQLYTDYHRPLHRMWDFCKRKPFVLLFMFSERKNELTCWTEAVLNVLQGYFSLFCVSPFSFGLDVQINCNRFFFIEENNYLCIWNSWGSSKNLSFRYIVWSNVF